MLNTKTKLYEEVAGPLVPTTTWGARTGTSVSVSGDGKTICAGQSVAVMPVLNALHRADVKGFKYLLFLHHRH